MDKIIEYKQVKIVITGGLIRPVESFWSYLDGHDAFF